MSTTNRLQKEILLIQKQIANLSPIVEIQLKEIVGTDFKLIESE